jgi:hypothetical protein
MLVETATFERHYRIGELARIWGLGRETVRKLVKDDPGVIKIRLGRKKAHTIYSVPESAAHRIHTRLLNPGSSENLNTAGRPLSQSRLEHQRAATT